MPPITSAPVKQQRRALACLNCRAARAACEGQPPPEVAQKTTPPAVRGQEHFQVRAETPCPRCVRLSRTCVWVPSHRTGRPRKRQSEPSTTSQPPVTKFKTSTAEAEATTAPVGGPAGAHADTDVDEEADPTIFFQQLKDTLSTTTFDPYAQPTAPASGSQHSGPPSSQGQFPSMSSASRSGDLLQTIAPGLTSVPLPFDLDPVHLDASTLQSLESFLREDNVNAMGALLESSETSASTMPSPVDVFTPASQMAATTSSLNDLVKRLASAATPPGSTSHSGGRGQPSVSPTSSRLGHSPLSRETRSSLSTFFSRANQFLPVLGKPSAWIAGLEQAAQMNRLTVEARLALSAACAVGERLAGPSSRAAADQALANAKAALDEVTRNPPLPPSPWTPSAFRARLDRATYALQGSLLLSYVEYGLNELDIVERCMDLGKLICGSWGLHRIDALTSPGQGTSSSALPLESWASQQPLEAAEEVENLRRIWWELFLLDNMLVITTGGQVARRLKPLTTNVAVHLPADPGEPLNGNPFRECYDVRVRACALMSEAFAPTCPSIQEASARLVALDALHSDLLVRAHAGWREARADEKALSEDAGKEGTEADAALAAAARAESFFFSMIILHAGRIHLHRNVWLSDLNVGLSSCSLDFKPGSGGSFDGPATSYDPLGQQLTAALAAGIELPNSAFHSLPHSVEAITNASTTILDLVRSDYLERMAEAQQARLGHQVVGTPPLLLPPEPTSPFLRHGPFFACALMVSAYGTVVGVAAKKQEDASSRLSGNNGQVSPRSMAANCSVDVWRQRTFLSHLCFAEATAFHMSKVFPRIRGYAAEIQVCRTAVDASAPSLLT